MDDITETPPPPPREPQYLDALSFFGSRRSCIEGLGGGKDVASDPTYAFHTQYVDCGVGPVMFTIRLAELRATVGTLSVRINALPEDRRNDAKTLKSAQIDLARLAEAGGEVSYRVVARRGLLYAMLGQVLDHSDAAASDITIMLDQVDDGSVSVEELAEARHTVFGNAAMKPVPHLLSVATPTLASPGSQFCTAAQLAEPALARLVAELGGTAALDRRGWEEAFVLQVLRAFGMIQPGASGIGFSARASGIAAVFAASDCTIDLVTPPGADGEPAPDGFVRDAVCPRDRFEDHVTLRAVPVEDLPAGLRDFDFLWSLGTISGLGTIAAAAEFIERSTTRLAEGGVAVHLFDLRVDDNDAEVDEGGGPLVLRRRHIERIAIALVASGHEVSQIHYAGARFGAWGRKPDPVTNDRLAVDTVGGMRVASMALIVRRGSG